MTGFDHDVAIVGLGPAGAILAARLGPGLRVLALDKKLPAGADAGHSAFQKPCGGMLAPDAQKALSRFDMTLPRDILVDPQIFSVRTIDLKTGLVRHYQRHYVNMDRHRFDTWLMGHIPSRVDVRHGAVCTAVSRLEGGGFSLHFRQGAQSHTATARYVVGADGAASRVRRALYPGFRIQSFMAIQQWFEDAHPTPFYSCIFDPDITPSYAWGLTKDSAFIFGGAFGLHSARADFEALKAKLGPYGFRLDSPVKTEACLVLRPFGPLNHCYGRQGAFLAGEAAGFISPSSLEGISYAIESGRLLATCLNRAARQDPNRAYGRATRGIRLKLTAKYLKHPFMYTPPLRSLVMRSGITAIDMATQAE